MFVDSFLEKRVEQILELASLVDKALSAAGIEYRVVGGLATYLYVESRVRARIESAAFLR